MESLTILISAPESLKVWNYETKQQCNTELLSLYQSTDQYDVPQLRRDIMDTCHGNSPSPKRCGSSHKQEGAQTLFIPPANLILEAYETLSMTSTIISWMVDMCALCFQSSIMQGENWPAEYNELPKDFFQSLYKKSASNGTEIEKRIPCDYHKHLEDANMTILAPGRAANHTSLSTTT